MQRVATELHEALLRHPGVELDDLLLQTSWRKTHLRTVPFCLRVVRQALKRARAQSIDGVLFSSMVTAATAPLLRRSLADKGIPMAAIVHGRDVTLPVPFYQSWVVPRIFSALDAVLPVSRATGHACQMRGLPEPRCHVVPNGVDTGRFSPPEDRATARRLLRHVPGSNNSENHLGENTLPTDALLLCSVGRQVPRKGFAWFVDNVMPRLPQHVHYWMAGDGPEAGAIEEAAWRNGLERRVRRLGRISEEALKRLYQGSDLFIMPNLPNDGDMEGFGVVMLEAGLCGLPALAARLEGIRDVIEEGKNGHLVGFGKASEYARLIRRYDRDRESLRSLSARAEEFTRSSYAWEAVADEYVEALKNVVGLRREPVPA